MRCPHCNDPKGIIWIDGVPEPCCDEIITSGAPLSHSARKEHTMIDATCTNDCAKCPLTPHIDCPGKFEFDCSCEIALSGELWCCDVCSTTLDPTGQLVTEEQDRILGWDVLLPRYRTEAHAVACGVSEEEIFAAREDALIAWDNLFNAQRTQLPSYDAHHYIALEPAMLGEGGFKQGDPF
jgi:hypothetical protein